MPRPHSAAVRIAIDTVRGFFAHNGVADAAGIAFYTVFSLAPMVIFIIAVAGAIYGEQAVRGELADQISQWISPESAKQVETLVQNASKPRSGIIASLVGLGTLIVGATGAFSQLSSSMNEIWEVKARRTRESLWLAVRARLVALAMIGGISILLLASILASAFLAGVEGFFQDALPSWLGGARLFSLGFSLFISTALFTAMYVGLPAAKVRWIDGLAGGVVAALLFAVGRWGVGEYIRISGLASVYGAAGSLIVILVWVYYSTIIVLVGAEVSRAFSVAHQEWASARDGKQPAAAASPGAAPDPSG